MTDRINIRDWDGHDRSQYFSGSYVLVNTTQQQVVARIESFDGDSVSVTAAGRHMSVNIDSIDWDGLPPPRCVSYDNMLYFISPLGARTTRKPITRGNLGTVRINANGQRTLTGREPSQEVVELYLRGPLYPTSIDEATYMVQHNPLGALSPVLGYVKTYEETYDEDEDSYNESYYFYLYHHSIKVYESDDENEFLNYLENQWEELNHER